MRKFKRVTFLLMIVLSCCYSCMDQDPFGVTHDDIAGDYKISYVDLPKNRSIHYGNGADIVSPYVYAVGNQGHFIIAKQHPLGSKGAIDTTLTYYFIVDMNHPRAEFGEGVSGPLDYAGFLAACDSLQLKNVKFDMNYPENP